MLQIAVVLEPCEEGGFSAHVPTLPGCFGEGESVEETLSNVRDAVEAHLLAVEDDLIVDEGSKVFVLTWVWVPSGERTAESSADPGVPVSPGVTPPSKAFSSTGPKPRGIMIDDDDIDPDEGEEGPSPDE